MPGWCCPSGRAVVSGSAPRARATPPSPRRPSTVFMLVPPAARQCAHTRCRRGWCRRSAAHRSCRASLPPCLTWSTALSGWFCAGYQRGDLETSCSWVQSMSPGVGLTWMKSGRLLSGLVAIDVRVGVRVFGCVRARVCGMCARCMGVGVPAGLQAPPVPICSVRISGGAYAVRVGRTPPVPAALGEGVA